MTCTWAAYTGYLHLLVWVLQNDCPLPTEFTTIHFQYKYLTASRKLLHYYNHTNLQFENKSLIETWIRTIDDICSELCYNDLSLLVKSFI